MVHHFCEFKDNSEIKVAETFNYIELMRQRQLSGFPS